MMLSLIKRPVFPALIILVLPFIFYGSHQDAALTSRFLFLAIVVMALNVFTLARYRELLPELSSFAAIPAARLLLGLWLLNLISLSYANNLVVGIYESIKALVFLNTFWLIYLFLKEKRNRIFLLRLCVILTFMLAVVSAYQFSRLNIPIDDAFLGQYALYKVEAFFANKNIFAQVSLLLIPLLLIGYLSFTERVWKAISMLGILILLLLIIYLRSKVALFCLGLGGLVAMGLIFTMPNPLRNKFDALSSRIKTLVGGLALTVIIGIGLQLGTQSANLFQGDIIQDAFSKDLVLNLHKESTLLERILMWQNTLSMILENPLGGVGAGNWDIYFPKYGIGGTHLINDASLKIQRPHNDFLLVFAELGVLGIILYIGVFWTAILTLLKGLKKPESDNKWMINFYLLFGLICFLVFSMFSFPHERVFPQTLSLLYLALIFRESRLSRKETVRFTGPFIFAALLCMSIFASWWTWKRAQNEKIMYETILSSYQGNWQDVIRRTGMIDPSFLLIDQLSFPVSWYTATAYFQLNKVDKALKHYQLAKRANPYNANILNDIATSYAVNGQIEDAVYFYKSTLNLMPRFPIVIMNLASIYYNKGDYDRAYSTIIQINDPEAMKDEKLRAAAYTILGKRLQNLASNSANTQQKEKLQKLIMDKELLISLFNQAISKRLDFQDQLKAYLES